MQADPDLIDDYHYARINSLENLIHHGKLDKQVGVNIREHSTQQQLNK